MIPSLAMVCMPVSAIMAPHPAWAQVSVNPGALDQLQPAPASPAASAKPAAKPAAKRSAHRPVRPAHPAAAGNAKTQSAAKAAPPAKAPTPSLAPAPPPTVTLPPPIVTQRVVPVPPPVPIVQDAPGAATAIPNGTRVTFGPGSSDLNPATAAAIGTIARNVAQSPGTDINLYAYATGPSDDPSTPRRLSLSRALAVRAMLISQGIVSERIYPRVMPPTPPGAATGGPPADRVDVIASSGAPSPESAAPK
jgi:outer membrane protein OmpA-like peptidoglycan-associated protein